MFIETNIRRVFIHFFFADREGVHDNEIMPLVEQTLDRENPRQWYYALMDYGTLLAKQVPNPNRRSRHYSKQSKFEGSDRQIRGRILKALVSMESVEHTEFMRLLADEEGSGERVEQILGQMEKEGMIVRDKIRYSLPK